MGVAVVVPMPMLCCKIWDGGGMPVGSATVMGYKVKKDRFIRIHIE